VYWATTIRRIVALIAIAGLVLAPMTLSVGATAMKMPAAMDHAAMDPATMDSAHSGMAMHADMAMSDMAMSSEMAMPSDMECCPKKTSHVPGCGMDCPFMALCMGVGLQSDRVASLYVPSALVSTMIPANQRDLDGLAQAPPIRPPNA
jgi:hypothetical protein